MKIKGLVITGILFGCAGVTLACYATTRPDFDINKYKTSNIKSIENNFDASSIKNIKIDSCFDTIEIKKVDRNDVYIKSKDIDELKYTITLNENTLSISQSSGNWKTSFFSTHWNNAYAFSKTPTVIEVPSDISFSYDIKLGAGTINANDINSESLKVSIDAGTANLTDISAKNLTVKIDAGTCKFDNAISNSTSINVSAGTLEYRGIIEQKGDIVLNAGTVNLSFQNTVDDYIINGHGSGKSIITVDNSIGTFDYSFENN